MAEQTKSVRFPKALNSEGAEIHILDAERGRKGYYCTGCKKEAEAVKPKLGNIQAYFRHVATDVSIAQSECTWSSETYRHRIAKEVLQRIKSIKVPRLLKFPPKGNEGDPKLIKGTQTITAYRVDVEKSFYLDNHGVLRSGPWVDEGIADPSKNCLIVPDVIFFDNSDRPILFIELVASHDIDDAKLAKIKALKVNTVKVNLPHESSEAIEECFFTTERTKWIYSYEREQANYFSLPGNFIPRIQGIDRIERSISFESSGCRKIRIRNLIRGVRRSLEGGGFAEIRERTQREIESIEQELSRRRAMEDRIDHEVSEGFRERRESIKQKQGQIERISSLLEARYKLLGGKIEIRGLQLARERRKEIADQEQRIERLYPKVRERYERKGEALDREEKDLEELLRDSEKLSYPFGRDSIGEEELLDGAESELRAEFVAKAGELERKFVENCEQVESEIRAADESIEGTESSIFSIRSSLETLQRDFERQRSDLESRHRVGKGEMERNFRELERRERATIERLRIEQNEMPGGIESARGEIEDRFAKLRAEVTNEVERRNTNAGSRLSRQIRELVYAGQLLSDYTTSLVTFKRYRAALRFIESEAFKAWRESRGAI
jgi:hypothetical protein